MIFSGNDEFDFDSAVPVKIINPLFSRSSTHSFPFNIAATEHNLKLVKWSHLTTHLGKNQVNIPAMIRSKALHMGGEVSFIDVANRQIECYFKSNMGRFYNQHGKKKLNELINETLDFDDFPTAISAFNSTLTKIYPDTGYTFPYHENHEFVSNWPFNPNYINKINDYVPVDNTLVIGDGRVHVPMLFVGYIIEKIFTGIGYRIKNNVFKSNADFQRLILYNNVAINNYEFEDHVLDPYYIVGIEKGNTTTITTSYSFGTLLRTGDFVYLHGINGMQELNNQVFQIEVNPDETTKFSINIDSNDFNDYTSAGVIKKQDLVTSIDTSINLSIHVPGYTVIELMEALRNYMGFEFFIDDTVGEVTITHWNDILTSRKVINISSLASSDIKISEENYDGYRLQTTPDGNDSWYKKKINQSVVDYNRLDDVDTYDDLPSENDNGDVRLVVDENNFYIYQASYYAANSGWKFLSHNLLDKIEGAGDVELKTNFSTILSINNNPRVDMPGCTVSLKPYFEELPGCGLRLALYNGPMNDTHLRNDVFYVLDGDSVRFKLDFYGENGIYEKYLKRYIDFKLDRERFITCKVDWSYDLLSSIGFDTKYRINGVDYLVKEIPMNVYPDKIEVGETELVKI